MDANSEHTVDLLPAFTGVPELNRVYHTDALTLLRALPDASVDCILTDPPYGSKKTKLDWDKSINWSSLWPEIKRVMKLRGAVLIHAAMPFSAILWHSNPAMYRYSWYVEKSRGSNFGTANHQPLRVIEDVLVFSHAPATSNQYITDEQTMAYYPVKQKLNKPYKREEKAHHKKITDPSLSSHVQNAKLRAVFYEYATPRNLLYFSMDTDPDRGLHPTQKSIAEMSYFIETYTRAGDTILDCFAGSGTTLVAARNLGRHYIGCDLEHKYVEIARRRLAQPYTVNMFAGGILTEQTLNEVAW